MLLILHKQTRPPSPLRRLNKKLYILSFWWLIMLFSSTPNMLKFEGFGKNKICFTHCNVHCIKFSAIFFSSHLTPPPLSFCGWQTLETEKVYLLKKSMMKLYTHIYISLQRVPLYQFHFTPRVLRGWLEAGGSNNRGKDIEEGGA